MAAKKAKRAADDGAQAPAVTTAAVVADTFGPELEPVASLLPPLLFPVCDVPIVEYMLDWLGANGVDHVVIAAASGCAAIANYLARSVWATPCAPYSVAVDVVDCADCDSYCAVLRKLHQHQEDYHLAGTFLLVNGPVVANFALAPLVEAHRAHCAAVSASQHVATLAVRPAERALVDTAPADAPQFVALAGTRLVTYPEPYTPEQWALDALPQSEHGTLRYSAKALVPPTVALPLEELRAAGRITVRPDLVPCHVAVVDASWLAAAGGDNADVADFAHLVATLLSFAAISRFVIQTYQVPALAFAARVDSWRTYAHTTTAVLRRAAHPYCPETNLLTVAGRITTFARRYGNVLVGDGAAVSAGAQLGHGGVLVGSGARIEDGAAVSGVVGAGATVGAGSVLENCVLWPGAHVGAGVRLAHSIVCAVGPHAAGGEPFGRLETEVGDGVTLDCAVVFPGVRVAEGTTGPPRAYVGPLDACCLPLTAPASPRSPVTRITPHGLEQTGFLSSLDEVSAPRSPRPQRSGLRRMSLVAPAQALPVCDAAVSETNGRLPRAAWVAFSPAAHVTRAVAQVPLAEVLGRRAAQAAAVGLLEKEDPILTRIVTRCLVQQQIALGTMLTEVRSYCTARNISSSLDAFDLVADAVFRAVCAAPGAREKPLLAAQLLSQALQRSDDGYTLRQLLAELYCPGKAPTERDRQRMGEALLDSFRDISVELDTDEAGASNVLAFLASEKGLVSAKTLRRWARDVVAAAYDDEDDDERAAAAAFLRKTKYLLRDCGAMTDEQVADFEDAYSASYSEPGSSAYDSYQYSLDD